MANGTGNTQDEADARFLETLRRLKGGAAPAAPLAAPTPPRSTAEQATANVYGFDTPIATPPAVSPTGTPPPVSQIEEPSIQRKAYNQTPKLGTAAPPSVEQKADNVTAGFNSAPPSMTPPPTGAPPPLVTPPPTGAPPPITQLQPPPPLLSPPPVSQIKEPSIQRKAYNQTGGGGIKRSSR